MVMKKKKGGLSGDLALALIKQKVRAKVGLLVYPGGEFFLGYSFNLGVVELSPPYGVSLRPLLMLSAAAV